MNKFNNFFKQIPKIFPRSRFEVFVKETNASVNKKGFSGWDQLVAILFCLLCQAHTLREIFGGLTTALGKLTHLGLNNSPSLAFAYTNKHRS